MDISDSDLPGEVVHSERPIFLHRGRGATVNIANRFENDKRAAFDDGWSDDDGEVAPLATTVSSEMARTILTRNESPDIPFNVSINPYRGCEHGCVYCFARPTHSYLGLSPGLDFESRLFAKVNAVELLTRELAHRNYHVEPIAIGVNTDAYQPIERKLSITRGILQVLQRSRHPCTLITKSSLIERDIDLLAEMAQDGLCRAAITLTTLDHALSRKLEPRASSPTRRLRTIETLVKAGIPVSVSVSPIIPFINDQDMESILDASAHAGASNAHFIVLRLPWELNQVFQDWLAAHYPDRAERVMNRIRDMRGGRDYDSRFGTRMRGEGIWSDLFRQRFHARAAKLALNQDRRPLNCSLFTPPVAPAANGQIDLFAT